MISYCRNLEDVLIQRVLADVAGGGYLDIGAGAPVEDSNTCALYRRGWRGIVVDPLLDEAAWRTERPGDMAVRAMAGAMAGTGALHVFPEAMQISTGSAVALAHVRRHGREPAGVAHPAMVTVDALLDARGAAPLHLVSIDVEGMEAEVLAGFDLSRHRPWLLVIEAVMPGTPTPSHAGWEPRLLGQGYRMMHFDGVNRFYLAEERMALAPRLAVPPNIFDEYTRDAERRAEARIAELEARVALQSAELIALRGRR